MSGRNSFLSDGTRRHKSQGKSSNAGACNIHATPFTLAVTAHSFTRRVN